MVEWPGRCMECKRVISDWSEAGFTGVRWVHQSCWRERRRRLALQGQQVDILRSPVERSGQLELPLLAFLLMFHFGLAAAVAGWVLLARGSTTAGGIALAFGLVVPVIGAAGVASNLLLRRHIEIIRRQIEYVGGWKGER